MDLWKLGRSFVNGKWVITDKKLIVTKAEPGQSLHAYGLALDVVADSDLKKRGVQWSWSDKRVDGSYIQWSEMGKISKSLGLEWAGDWIKFTELRHSQNRYGFKISQLYPILVNEGLESVWKKLYLVAKPSTNIIPVTVAIPTTIIPVPAAAIAVPMSKDIDSIIKTETSKISRFYNTIINIFNGK